MNIIICLDDKNGVLFASRRQSRDRVLCERVIELSKGSNLFMNKYSANLFSEFDCNICVDNDFLSKATENDYCFVENTDITPFIDKIKCVIIYRWNRIYPSDVRLDTQEFLKNKVPQSVVNFTGASHDKITEEIYII